MTFALFSETRIKLYAFQRARIFNGFEKSRLETQCPLQDQTVEDNLDG